MANVQTQTVKQSSATDKDADLDEIMLAMDVVDTLRREQILLEKDLAVDERRADLVDRLRTIYASQGISVPDDVLMDGVLALESERFAYQPPKPGLSRSLAKIYINRRKWLPLLSIMIAVGLFAWAINYVGFVRPQQVQAAQNEKLLTTTLPQELEAAYERARDLAATDELKARSDAMYAQGERAIEEKNIAAAQDWTDRLDQYGDDLAQTYQLRIVSRPGEYSGVFRINSDGGTEVRNYYLIVEAIGPDGRRVTVPVDSEEDQRSARTNIWGLRVGEDVFDAVAADKQDDQIIQKAVIGSKRAGYMAPDYNIDTPGGQILDW